MKYFGIIDKNVAAIFQFQWKIENISDMLLQYSVLCGYIFSYIFLSTVINNSYCDNYDLSQTFKRRIIVFLRICFKWIKIGVIKIENCFN